MQLYASSSDGMPERRIALAGVVGVILPVALLTWVGVMAGLFPDSPQCGGLAGCLGYLFQAWEIGRWVAIVLAWPLLHLLRVRPSGLVAVLAGLFLATIWQVAATMPFAEALTLIMFSGVIAYPLAAWLVTQHMPRRQLILAAASLLALHALAFLLTYGQ